MEKKYISFDIEASGPTSPGKYSMLSLGACVVGDMSKQFYREIKPTNGRFDLSAMRISAKGLKCLDGLRHLDKYNYKSDEFDACGVLYCLYKNAEEPQKVMQDYRNWVLENTKGFFPVAAAAPIVFDGAFVNYYFSEFNVENPFGHSGEDINSMYRGFTRNPNSHIRELGIRGADLPHNALEDAIIQAKEMERVLELMRG